MVQKIRFRASFLKKKFVLYFTIILFSPETERFKVAISGVAVGNYMKMHYSDMGWYIGSI